MDASSSCYTQSLVTALKAATLSDGSKITLWSWTVDSKDTATNFYNWGIDSITSNRVDYALQALNASSASKTTTWTGNAQDSNFANPENFSDNLTPSENKVIFSNGTAQLTNSLTMASLTMGNGSTLDINNGGRGAAAVLTMDTGSNLNINQGAGLPVQWPPEGKGPNSFVTR